MTEPASNIFEAHYSSIRRAAHEIYRAGLENREPNPHLCTISVSPYNLEYLPLSDQKRYATVDGRINRAIQISGQLACFEAQVDQGGLVGLRALAKIALTCAVAPVTVYNAYGSGMVQTLRSVSVPHR